MKVCNTKSSCIPQAMGYGVRIMDNVRNKTLDGWRGVAILLVVVCHAASSYSHFRYQLWANYAGLGVDIFFVISGYIITLHFIREARDKHPSGCPVFMRGVSFAFCLSLFPTLSFFVWCRHLCTFTISIVLNSWGRFSSFRNYQYAGRTLEGCTPPSFP